MSRGNTAPARERILATAGALFSRGGFRGVGVDRLIAESGVAKATFYKHFSSKDDLIVAWLERADAHIQATQENTIKGEDPIIDLFKGAVRAARSPEWAGCTFQGVSCEFPETSNAGHQVAIASKRKVIARLAALAERAGLGNPDAVAEQLFVLMEGIWASVRVFGSNAPLDHVVDAARAILAAAR
jgi:AcrR family transcriptional regulator